MKILVVEDDPTSLKLAHLVLSVAGHDVAKAETVDKAIEQIIQTKPDVILLDLCLPNVDGLTLARRLKNAPATSHIVIIGITCYPELYSRKEAMDAGCDTYIVKPLDTRRLTAQVARAAEHQP